jgi:hypothetical protein
MWLVVSSGPWPLRCWPLAGRLVYIAAELHLTIARVDDSLLLPIGALVTAAGMVVTGSRSSPVANGPAGLPGCRC